MELTQNEIRLIQAVREMDEPPGNILLWYSAGLKESYEKTKHIWDGKDVRGDLKKIEIARKYMNEM